jgi:hypothetical protein
MVACAAFFKESRMKFVEPAKPNRKSGFWGTRALGAETKSRVSVYPGLSRRNKD